jgi:transposase
LVVNKYVSIEKYEALAAENAAQKSELAALRHELAELKRMIFASQRERFVPAEVPQQLDLGFEQAAEPVAQEVEKETITYQRSKKAHPGRDKLPEDIPTEDIIIEPEEDTTDMERIGEEITETIDYRPGLLIKRRYIRPKYARKEALQEQPGVLIAELPERPIPKGIAEPGLLAHLFVSKYIDHLPFYRQTKIFKRQHDWDIHKATINSWFVACCTLMEPLYEALFKQVMQTDYLQADESPIKVFRR